MATALADLIEPKSTAIVCMEMQRGVVGDLSLLPPIAAAIARSGMPQRLAALMSDGRKAGAQVVFCNAVFRPDRKGSALNCPMFSRFAKVKGHMQEGTPSAEVIPALPVLPEDLVSARYHGMSPFTGTSLDAWLRNLGIRTVIATGVSLNIGILAMTLEAIGLGYRVVLPRDCASGTPDDYVEGMLANTYAPLATLSDGEAIRAVWAAAR